jgi:hypothetical protein
LNESELEYQVPSPWWNDHRIYSVAEMIEQDAIGHSREHAQQIVTWKQNRPTNAPA